MSKRNGTIEIYRFILSILIALFHAEVFKNGYLVVDFFFIVSGYFLYRSVEKSSGELTEDTLLYCKSKIVRLMPSVVLAWAACFLYVNRTVSIVEFIKNFLLGLWNLLLVDMTGLGISSVYNRPTWYLSAMMICSVFLFPILKKFGKLFVLIYSPIIVLFLLGSISFSDGCLERIFNKTYFFYHGMLRGCAGLLCGCISYYIAKKISGLNFSFRSRIIISFSEIILFIFILFLIYYWGNSEIDFVVFALFFVLVSIVFSEKSLCGVIFNNSLCYWLGSISYSLYLIHTLCLNILVKINKYSVVNFLVFSFISAIVLMYASNAIIKLFRHYTKKSHI